MCDADDRVNARGSKKRKEEDEEEVVACTSNQCCSDSRVIDLAFFSVCVYVLLFFLFRRICVF